jgi:hypothetical protein
MTTPVVPSLLSHCKIAFVAEAVVKLQTELKLSPPLFDEPIAFLFWLEMSLDQF